jgi:hypothetical protein
MGSEMEKWGQAPFIYKMCVVIHKKNTRNGLATSY